MSKSRKSMIKRTSFVVPGALAPLRSARWEALAPSAPGSGPQWQCPRVHSTVHSTVHCTGQCSVVPLGLPGATASQPAGALPGSAAGVRSAAQCSIVQCSTVQCRGVES